MNRTNFPDTYRSIFYQLRLALIAIALLFGVSVRADEAEEKNMETDTSGCVVSVIPSIPETVSKAAQTLLQKYAANPRTVPSTPKTDADWKARQEYYRRTYGKDGLERALQQVEGVTIKTDSIARVTVRWVRPATVAPRNRGVILMQFHGGAYVYGDGEFSIVDILPIVQQGKIEAVSVDYRMPPEHPFPAAVEDGVAVYSQLIRQYDPEKIAIIGSSAGGGLAAAVVLAIREKGLPLPGALILRSPWTDLSRSGDSYGTLEGIDPVLSYEGVLEAAALIYAGNKDLKTPTLSPVYGDFSAGFPPTLLISGTRDLFLSNTVRVHRKLRQAGVDAELNVFEGMWHGFYGLSELPEATDALNETLDFINRKLAN